MVRATISALILLLPTASSHDSSHCLDGECPADNILLSLKTQVAKSKDIQKHREPFNGWTSKMVDGCPGINENLGWEGHTAEESGSMSQVLIPTTVHTDPADTAAVRCCSIDGSSCATDGCNMAATYTEAFDHCAAEGQRLCTEAEMNSDLCCSTGCWFNHHACWVKQKPATTADGCPRDNKNPGNSWNAANSGDMSQELIPTVVHSDPHDTAAVRCCSMDGSSCATNGCHRASTWAEVHDFCAADGKRLCTEAEMESNMCCGTGCWFNHYAVWVD